jgi:class 3 adenylate cyclase/tetratricopeptide (TPR) repeat protein
MICPECQTELPENARFCKQCGRKIDLTCSGCGKIVPPDSKFCGDCGHDLCRPVSPKDVPKIDYQQPQSYTPKHLADKILTTRSAIEGERKIVTVLFADVAGFSVMSEKLDPEDVHAVMDGCFRILLDQVHACEGTVNEFRGDGVMALFGAPIAHEDHAQRACYAALAIQHALIPYGEKLKEEYDIDFKMRIGLNSGSVVVGAIGDDLRMDYTAQGDTANLAARMESSAQPGTVLVAEATYRLVGDAFEFEPLRQIPVKGKEKPVAVFRLKDKAFKARARSEREVYSEMVGRDQELSRLELQILKAVNGEGSVVNVVGEAGIGKSRLMAELKKRDVVKRVMLLEGRAISMGKNLSFYPIITLLKNWAHIREDDGETAAMNKLQEAIRRVSVEEADEIFPFVGTLMGMKLSGKHAERIKGIEGEALEKLIFKNVRELLIRSTELIPIVIVIEDLHWADTSSLILIDALYRLARNQKVVFINVFRPGYWENEDKNPANLKDRMTDLLQVELVLQPLDSQSSETLINNMLNIKGLHHGIKTRIIERAGGNPFFIEEVVRGLIDEGAVVVKDGGFEVTDKIHSVVIPPTINDVLMARIDRLDEESRNVIKVASVIGRSFFYRILADVISRVDGLDDKLEYLKQIQLIRERMQMNELEYLFKHALAQEAAYESTLLQQRKQLHLKVAESIERLFSERLHEFYGILAMHYSRADNLEKAEEYIVKAGEEALRSSASSEAITYFLQALQFYTGKHGQTADPEKLAGFEKNLAMAYHSRGQFREALQYFDKVFIRWGRREPGNRVSRMVKFALDLFIILLRLYLPWTGRKTIADKQVNDYFDLAKLKCRDMLFFDQEKLATDTIALIRESFRYDPAYLDFAAESHLSLCAIFAGAGWFGLMDRALETAPKAVKDQSIFDIVFQQLAISTINFYSGKWAEMPEYDKLILKAGAENGSFFDVGVYLTAQGMFKVYQGKFSQAREIFDGFIFLEEKYGYGPIAQKYIKHAELFVYSRLLFEAKNMANVLISFSVKMGQIDDLQGYGWRAVAQVLMKDINGARDSLEQAEQCRRKHSFWTPVYLSSSLLGQFLLDLHLLEEAIGGGSRSLISKQAKATRKSGRRAIRNATKFPPRRTENYRLMGEYYWLVGKQRKAFQWFDKSIKEGERLGARPDLSRTYMEVGKRLQEPQSKFKELNGISAPEYLSKAETLFHEMGLQWDLEQLERVRAGSDG